MRRSAKFTQRLPLWVVVIVPLLVFALACGPGEEITPTPTTGPEATPTTPTGPVATPTPTTEAPPVTTPSAAPQRGGIFRMASEWSLTNWDPHINARFQQGYYTQPMSNNLIFNPRGQTLICEICVNDQYSLENAGKTMVFNLRQGIKFHDGTEMTSADVKHSLLKIMGEVDGIVSPRCGVIKEYIDTIEAPSRYQVRVNLFRPAATLPVVLQFPHCSLVQDGSTMDDLKPGLVGTGPWLLKEYRAKASATFVPNPNYWKPGLPYFDQFVLYWVADSTAEVTVLLANRIDFWVRAAQAALTFKPEIDKLKAAGKIKSYLTPSTTNAGVYPNHARPPFSDLKVRQAANLAIDRKGYGATLRGGVEGVDYLAYIFFPSDAAGNWGRPPSEIWDVAPGWGTGAKKAAEIQQAKQLVIDAGYTQGVTTEYVHSGTANELVMRYFQDVGITTKVITKATSTEVDRQTQDGLYDWQTVSRTQITRDPDEWFLSYWSSGGSRNWMGYSNPKFDQLAVEVSGEVDPVKRKQLVRQAENILLDDVAMFPFTGGYSEPLWWTYLKGVEEGSIIVFAGSGEYRFEDWWFDESLR